MNLEPLRLAFAEHNVFVAEMYQWHVYVCARCLSLGETGNAWHKQPKLDS